MQPEDALCHGDRDPPIMATNSLFVIYHLFVVMIGELEKIWKCLWPNLRYYLGICMEGLKTAEPYWDI